MHSLHYGSSFSFTIQEKKHTDIKLVAVSDMIQDAIADDTGIGRILARCRPYAHGYKKITSTMKWQDSSGLIFGKIEGKLISFEPQKNGICAMVWGAPGDGKTTSTIITSCRQFGLRKTSSGKLVQKGAVMVTDLKGDIYEANKKYRRIKRFSTIHWQESAHYDPLVDARKMKPNERAIFLENLAITIIPEDRQRRF